MKDSDKLLYFDKIPQNGAWLSVSEIFDRLIVFAAFNVHNPGLDQYLDSVAIWIIKNDSPGVKYYLNTDPSESTRPILVYKPKDKLTSTSARFPSPLL